MTAAVGKRISRSSPLSLSGCGLRQTMEPLVLVLRDCSRECTPSAGGSPTLQADYGQDAAISCDTGSGLQAWSVSQKCRKHRQLRCRGIGSGGQMLYVNTCAL